MKKPTFEQAKRQFVNRYTLEHVPKWTGVPCEGNGLFYAPQYHTDKEWYSNLTFDEYGEASSNNQSWPLGNWLTVPFKKATK